MLIFTLGFLVSLLTAVYGLAVAAFSILGIVNVCNGEAKELPLINKIKFVK